MNARLDKLPIEIWGNKFPVDIKMVYALTQTSRHFGFFSNSAQVGTPIMQALKLMHLIFHDNQAEAKALININPRIIFANVTILTPENTVETINAWEYAIKQSSVPFIKMLRDLAIHNTDINQRLILTKAPTPNKLDSYAKSVYNYYDAYSAYLTKQIDENNINNEMLKVGKQQKTIPVWMLKKLLQQQDICNENSSNPVASLMIAFDYKNPGISIDFSKASEWSRLGKDITIVRGSSYNNSITNKAYYTSEAVSSASITKDLRTIMDLQSNANKSINNILKAIPKKIKRLKSSDHSNTKRLRSGTQPV